VQNTEIFRGNHSISYCVVYVIIRNSIRLYMNEKCISFNINVYSEGLGFKFLTR